MTPRTHVLVTGAAGFIGARVVSALVARGASVTAVARGPAIPPTRDADVQVAMLDIGDAASLRRALHDPPDVCLHAAWEGVSGTDRAETLNVRSLRDGLTLLEVLAEIGCRRFVGIGTAHEYAPATAPLDETAPIAPVNLYGAAKAALFFVGQRYAASAGMSFAWVRLFSVYGPGHRAGFVPSVVSAVLDGRVAQTTAGEQVRDLLYVDDAAAAISRVTLGAESGAINVASGAGVRLRDVAERVARTLGRPDLLRVGALPYRAEEPLAIQADVSRIRETGWVPTIGLDEGIARTVAWWRQRSSAW